MQENEHSRVIYPNHVAKKWETLFNPKKRQGHFLAFIVFGGVMTLISTLSIMFSEPMFSEPEAKVMALVFAAGFGGIVMVVVALYGVYAMSLNFIALRSALYGEEVDDVSGGDDAETFENPPRG